MQPRDEKPKNVVDLESRRGRQGATIQKKPSRLFPRQSKELKRQSTENATFRKVIAFVQLIIILGILAVLSRSCGI